VLLNLLGNAVKFTEHGTVTLRVRVIDDQPGPAGPSTRLAFEVEDTGVGIAPDQLEQIFQPFEQAGEAERRAAGTGLGLSISQSLVALMGGQVQVQSEPGRGSRFWFIADFPIAEPGSVPLSRASKQTITGYRGPRRHILVADDRPENRLVLLNLLEPLGFSVDLAENGRDAIAQAQERRPDLIFMDLVMPVMMGFEAVPALRQIGGLADVPIIAVSASVMEHDQSRQIGCDDFMTKPVDVDQVLDVLEAYLALEWVYTAPDIGGAAQPGEGSAVAAELVPPPPDELELLYELARLGNMERIQEHARRLEARSPEHRAFARQVIRLAEAFDDERLQDLIRPYLVAI
jgi:CheY-like chemotaxis protein